MLYNYRCVRNAGCTGAIYPLSLQSAAAAVDVVDDAVGVDDDECNLCSSCSQKHWGNEKNRACLG